MLFKKRTRDREILKMVGIISDGILESIKDGRQHDIIDVSEELEIPPHRLDDIINFLIDLGLVEKRIKITDSGRKFLQLPEL